MTGIVKNARPKLPPLTDLPVYRDTYCSQEMTDNILRHLWEKRPDLVSTLVAQEARTGDPHHIRANHVYKDIIDRLTTYLREDIEQGVKVPPSRLGMVDLLYELSRRIRKELNVPEVKLLGHPLAPAAAGPFPDLPNTTIWIKGITQEVTDRVLQEAYKQSPEVFYEQAEQMRRSISTYEIRGAVQKLLREISKQLSVDTVLWPHLSGELNHRLFDICKMKLEPNTGKGTQ